MAMADDDGGLFRDELGALHWWSARPIVAAPVTMAVADGLVVQVDVADPTRVLAWSARDAGAVPAAAELFGAGWRSAVDAVLSRDEPVPVRAPDDLPAEWARYAVVLGVQRWLPQAIDEGTLNIDLALGALGVGRRNEARARFDSVWPTLLYRAEECLDGMLPAAVRPQVLAATRAAALLLSGTEPAAELAERTVELETAQILDEAPPLDPDLDVSELADEDAWRGMPDEEARRGLRGRTRGRGRRGPDLVGRVDPRLVPARFLRWTGGQGHTILGEVEGGKLIVRVGLATGVDAADVGVRDVVVSLVDDSTGMVLATAPCTVGDDVTLLAQLPAARTVGVTAHVHRGDARHPFRFGPTGRRLLLVDRLLLEAWSEARLGRAGRGPGAPPAGRSRSAAQSAFDELDLLVVDLAGVQEQAGGDPRPAWLAGLRWRDGTPSAGDVRLRATAVRALLDGLEGGPVPVDDSVTGPLIAEREYVVDGPQM